MTSEQLLIRAIKIVFEFTMEGKCRLAIPINATELHKRLREANIEPLPMVMELRERGLIIEIYPENDDDELAFDIDIQCPNLPDFEFVTLRPNRVADDPGDWHEYRTSTADKLCGKSSGYVVHNYHLSWLRKSTKTKTKGYCEINHAHNDAPKPPEKK